MILSTPSRCVYLLDMSAKVRSLPSVKRYRVTPLLIEMSRGVILIAQNLQSGRTLITKKDSIHPIPWTSSRRCHGVLSHVAEAWVKTRIVQFSFFVPRNLNPLKSDNRTEEREQCRFP